MLRVHRYIFDNIPRNLQEMNPLLGFCILRIGLIATLKSMRFSYFIYQDNSSKNCFGSLNSICGASANIHRSRLEFEMNERSRKKMKWVTKIFTIFIGWDLPSTSSSSKALSRFERAILNSMETPYFPRIDQ